jgi:nicotinamidase/pyrazinamidase
MAMTVFFDVDSLLDFLYPAGALYVPGAEHRVAAISRLNRFAAEHGIPIVSTMDAHAENDPEFAHWPAHCVAGTLGQRKPAQTLVEERLVVPNRAHEFSVQGVRQFLIEKQTLDCFSSVNLRALLERLAGQRYVVYGVVTEYCVRHAVLGLLRLGAQVEVVADAIETLEREQGDAALKEFQAAGASLTTVAQVCG